MSKVFSEWSAKRNKLSETFSAWAAKRNKFVESIGTSKKEPTTSELQAIAETTISNDTFMIAYELDRLCDILERKGR